MARPSAFSRFLLVTLLFAATLGAPGLAAAAQPKSGAQPAAVDDVQILRTIETQGTKLIEAGKTTLMAELVQQLARTSCEIRLPKPAAKPAAAEQLYERCRKGVLVMAGIYKCDKCKRNHCNPASGFVISESGVAVTNYHVVNKLDNITLVAMAADGTIYPVKSVLAASAQYDVAILQLDGSGFTPLGVVPQAAVGSDVFVISHPDRRFFTFSKGIVARYGTMIREQKKVSMLQITAEYAKGSSGGPVLNSAGDVVGMVSSTVSVYYHEDHGKQEGLQMVVNQCVPSEQILELIKPK